MIAILEISAPTGTFRVRLRPGEVRIGRSPDCDIPVKDKLVSSRHATFSLGADSICRVRDMGSTNGIFVNGVRRAESALKAGDTVRLGATIATLYEETEPDGPGQSTTMEMHVVEASGSDDTGFDPYSITFEADEIAAEVASSAPNLATAAPLLVARTRLSLLHRLSQGIGVDSSLEGTLLHIAQVIREGVGPERIAILVSERDGGPAVRRFARNWRQAGDDENVYVPRLVVATAMYQRKVVLYHDLWRDPRFRDEPRLRELGVRQAMAAPIVYGSGVRGAIYVDRASPEPPFTAEELYLLGIVAHQSGATLMNQETFSRERQALEELKKTQEELLRHAKLAAIGELLAGVANEVNNPVAAIVGSAELIAGSAEATPTIREDARRIEREASRVRNVLSQLLALCRRTEVSEGSFNPERVVRAALEPRRRELQAKGISLELDFSRGIPPVAGDGSLVQQVIAHLVLNAELALDSRDVPGAGRILVRGRCDHERCRIVVEDDGPSIPADVLGRIFDPYFAGKGRNGAGGLGLSIALSIVRQHGGTLEARGDGARGARFTVDLPLKLGASVEPDQTGALAVTMDAITAAGEALRGSGGAGAASGSLKGGGVGGTSSSSITAALIAGTPKHVQPPGGSVAAPPVAPTMAPVTPESAGRGPHARSPVLGIQARLPGGGQRRRILVCDDESSVLDVMARAIEKAGHEVVRATSGEEALSLLAATEVDAVVTDLHLGALDGIRLSERALELRPRLAGRFLFVTGDTASAAYRTLLDRGAVILAKPFTLSELVSRVESALGDAAR